MKLLCLAHTRQIVLGDELHLVETLSTYIVNTFNHLFCRDQICCTVDSYTSPAEHNWLAECNDESIQFI